MKLSIVIPARNEARNITSTLDNLTGQLSGEGLNYEIIVVDDGSTDATAEQTIQRSAEDPRIRLVPNLGPHGFGYAVRKGLDAFRGDAVVLYMADSSDEPADVVRYFYVLRDQSECVFGSRFISGSRVEGYPKIKLAINRMANTFIRMLFGLKYNDTTNAFKGYRSYVIHGCRPFLSPHFNLTVELPLKAIVRGYSYTVVPISWRNRRIGGSSLHIEEMGSRYLFIVINIWLEKLLTGDDYKRDDHQVRKR
ncbi:MAG: cell wall biosynthesis glycosyltransferase [Dehalococcoidia bacterium]|nr:cell wall biosynthesis glycosyltransferase [Dehalococcoidia bacterium]